jgi:TRAP-type mannitol/chloroaromatic compound transport system substrate-binding protein
LRKEVKNRLSARRGAAAASARRYLSGPGKGAIDAAEWIGSNDDEKLGFVKMAPTITIPVGGGLRQWLPLHQQRQWAELAKSYQQMVTTVAAHVAGDRIAKYDSRNPPSIKRLVAAGARLRPVALDI